MNRIFFIVVCFALFASCSAEVVNDDTTTADVNTEIAPNEADIEPVDKEYLFESDDEGVKEFMRSTQTPDGKSSWVYFTAKNPKEIKLGSRMQAGFEVVYFLTKPKELYWIYGAECGFTLSDDSKRTSQWYAQVKPRCADDMFE